MKKYSPYENVAKKEYPDLLIMGSYNDSRVGYYEPTKLMAKIRFKCQVIGTFDCIRFSNGIAEKSVLNGY